MTDRVQLRPAEGRRVRIPETGEPMPVEGAEVALDLFWRRRLDDGDVIPVPAPTPGKQK